MHKGVSMRVGMIMQQIMSTVENMRDADCNVLLTGENGVGKTLLAKLYILPAGDRTCRFYP
jgi:DNA-binding NtrC family response regulator